MKRFWIMLCVCLLQPCWPGLVATADPAGGVLDTPALSRLIWQHNPELEQARLGLAQFRAELLRASLWQNPSLQVGAGTVPLARNMLSSPHYTNPRLDPLLGPNLSIALSQPVEFGKREVRIQRYQQSLGAARQNVLLLYRERLADLEAVLVQLAIARLRLQLLQAQIEALKTLMTNVRLSVRQGFLPPLEAERLALELGRIQVSGDAEQIHYESLRSQWADLTLVAAPTLTVSEAEALIQLWCQPPEQWPAALRAPHLALVEAQWQEARWDLALAQRMSWPDPAFQMGYVYDTLPTGNVLHSLNTSVLLQLPIWRYGQAEARAAEGRLRELARLRETLVTQLSFQEPAQRQRILTLSRNISDLQTQRLVLARATLQRYDQALKAHGITLLDLIQTRRTVLDLESERLDLLQQAGLALVEYRRLTHMNMPDPEGDF